MRRKVAVAGGAVVALVLAGILIFSGGDERKPVSLSVPGPSAEEPAYMPSRAQSMVTIIPPAALPITSQPIGTAPSKAAPTTTEQAVVPNAEGRINYYGARTNEPRGSRAIAYPNVLHGQAGGTGTFDDPLTFAAGEGKYKLGTKIYVPEVKRYFILEDLCPQCDGAEINLWAGPANDSGLADCVKSLARPGDRPYVVNPPAGLPVVAGDLYHLGRCYQLI